MNDTDRSAEIERLAASPWFAELPAALQARIREASVVRSFRKGQYLIREGERAKGLHGLLFGQTRHVRSAGDSGEVVLHVGEPGLWFGEYALVTRQAAAGSVIAATAVRTLFLPVAEFERIVELEPRHLRPFACLLGERFAVAYRYIAEEQVLSPAERLMSRLRGIVAMQRRDPADRQPTTISMSQAELANMLGLSRQTLNTLLAGLQSRGLIEVGYRRVRVLTQA
jgi:CRP-like cAMP-binding protein